MLIIGDHNPDSFGTIDRTSPSDCNYRITACFPILISTIHDLVISRIGGYIRKQSMLYPFRIKTLNHITDPSSLDYLWPGYEKHMTGTKIFCISPGKFSGIYPDYKFRSYKFS